MSDQSEKPLDPLEDLDDVFTFDSEISEKWKNVYEVIVARLRRESQHLDMQTVQLLLLERIAHNYIILRIKEDLKPDEGGFAHATAQKEYNTFWMMMTTEFNKMLRASSPEGKEALRKEVAAVMNTVINGIEDPIQRKKAHANLVKELQNHNL